MSDKVKDKYSKLTPVTLLECASCGYRTLHKDADNNACPNCGKDLREIPDGVNRLEKEQAILDETNTEALRNLMDVFDQKHIKTIPEDPIKQILPDITSILSQAYELIHGDRVGSYGSPDKTFPEIAMLATIITGKPFTAEDVCLIQVAVKLIRRKYSPENRDHTIDACGYLGIIEDYLQK